jgi:ACS family hexuronate transporter-like MFS transporter
MNQVSMRWTAVGVFALANALNFLDRQILAALAPQIMTEFGMSASGYGDVILAFSLTYAIAAPLAGLMIDKVGLRLGSAIAVAFWSVAAMATGLVSSLKGLVLCRAALGIGEAGGIPATGKASAVYLVPRERALGSAVYQMGLTIGAMTAPVFAQWISRMYGWRAAFMVAGALGFFWIPLWFRIERRAPKAGELATPRSSPVSEVLKDPRYWALLASNVLLMSVYSLWVNWTTLYLVREHGLTQQAANYQLAWIPPIFATAGGLFGGWLVFRLGKGAADVTPVRMTVIGFGCLLLLSNAAVPLMGSPTAAVALICLSFFACVAASVNIYALPLDLFGPGRAAFAVAGLTSAYGLLQGVFSAAVGRVVDGYGFGPVCVAVAVLPLGSWAVLQLALRRRHAPVRHD